MNTWNLLKTDLRQESLKKFMRKVNDIKFQVIILLSNFT